MWYGGESMTVGLESRRVVSRGLGLQCRFDNKGQNEDIFGVIDYFILIVLWLHTSMHVLKLTELYTRGKKWILLYNLATKKQIMIRFLAWKHILTH